MRAGLIIQHVQHGRILHIYGIPGRQSVLFPSGEVYAIGGYNGVKTVDVVEKYNPEEGTWKEVSPLVFGRSVPGIAVAYLWPVQSTMKSFWEPESQL